MATTIGVNVVATGDHPPQWVRSLGASATRIVLTPGRDLGPHFQDCVANGVKPMPLVARESEADEGQLAIYAEQVGQYVERVQVGNEADHPSDSSWHMPDPQELTDLGWLVKGAFPRAEIVCAGMVSGNPAYLNNVDLSPFDYVAVHPYAKDMIRNNDLEDIDTLVDKYRRFGRPIIISEWGWWGKESDGAEQVKATLEWAVATTDIAGYYHFCMSDTMVWPFGLLREDNSWKPQAYAFRDAVASVAGEAGVEPPSNVGWVGPGLQQALDERNWRATSGEYVTPWPIVWARTPGGKRALAMWNVEENAPITLREV